MAGRLISPVLFLMFFSTSHTFGRDCWIFQGEYGDTLLHTPMFEKEIFQIERSTNSALLTEKVDKLVCVCVYSTILNASF